MRTLTLMGRRGSNMGRAWRQAESSGIEQDVKLCTVVRS